MSFMAVAYVPAFLEDRSQYVKEHHNGLYGAAELVISNFLIGVPYLCTSASAILVLQHGISMHMLLSGLMLTTDAHIVLISILSSVISYFLINLRPGASAFFTFVMWLFLNLLAAESLVVFFSSLFPSFVASLALVAFANGLWMSVGGFLVQPTILNDFYLYVFHYWDYQKWVFEGMMVNEFATRVYQCAKGTGPDSACTCMWQTELADQCQIAGQGVLDQYGYRPGHMGRNVGIMLAIIFGYRVAAWLMLQLRK